MKEHAIILAGGSGLRIGGETPKQFIDLGGTSMLEMSIAKFRHYSDDIQLVVAIHPDFKDLWTNMVQRNPQWPEIEWVDGGKERYHSVKNALDSLPQEGLVAIHDAARPNVTTGLIQRSFDLARKSGSSIPVWPVSDSLRHVQGDQHQAVLRSEYVTVQTPQVFDLALIKRAYQQNFSDEFTDDASVVEKMGEQVSLVQGSPGNTKITSKPDLDFLRFQLLKH